MRLTKLQSVGAATALAALRAGVDAQISNAPEAAAVTVYLRPLADDSAAAETAFLVPLLANFTARTGIVVKAVFDAKSDSDGYLHNIMPVLGSSDPSVLSSWDVVMLNGLWTDSWPYFANLYDLDPEFTQLAAQQQKPIVQVDLINGNLVAMPYQSDYGVLFSRTDKLIKHGFPGPPVTWEQLATACRTILPLEPGLECLSTAGIGEICSMFAVHGSATFIWGDPLISPRLTIPPLPNLFYCSGNSLVMNTLEFSSTFTSQPLISSTGTFNFDSPAILTSFDALLNFTHEGFVSQDALTYDETTARNAWRQGKSLFYHDVISSASQSVNPCVFPKSNWTVSATPGSTPGFTASVVSGWHLALNNNGAFHNKTAVAQVIKFLTSTQVQQARAEAFGVPPSVVSLYQSVNSTLCASFFCATINAISNPIVIPSIAAKGDWIQFSRIIEEGIVAILNGSAPAAEVLQQAKIRLRSLEAGGATATMTSTLVPSATATTALMPSASATASAIATIVPANSTNSLSSAASSSSSSKTGIYAGAAAGAVVLIAAIATLLIARSRQIWCFGGSRKSIHSFSPQSALSPSPETRPIPPARWATTPSSRVSDAGHSSAPSDSQRLPSPPSSVGGVAPQLGRHHVVVHGYVPSMDDELELVPGQEVLLKSAYDDGYAFGEIATPDGPKTGVFPLASLFNAGDVQAAQIARMEALDGMHNPQADNGECQERGGLRADGGAKMD
ncbi:hypothetical protein BDK51DRAFT_51930 [Blyttiomyces helicus]|uniref:SH3 domain-containing protein n=1 Tax=Blyttiomyces helicus TaxID=388810 RepID=A0A4V1IR67_9FUNG|nr:hypothetical protein BDK51DRAFT_51930 [Blyttiomyces helicus]|eukprot:RKO88997.1 hypothetical protein BDK51DRAFT_51930 [Blyttiomyces helicus]